MITLLPVAVSVLNQLLLIRDKLKLDILAAYRQDPSAESYTEIIRSFPGFTAILGHRFSHELYTRGARDYAKELSYEFRKETGIEIHPGATIGSSFFIDHGAGVVIGETAHIGDNVRIYQGVTLGVSRFTKNQDGSFKKGYKRHPTIGNDVAIAADAKVLGPIRVGNGNRLGVGSITDEDMPDRIS